jgi:hypothetical protein
LGGLDLQRVRPAARAAPCRGIAQRRRLASLPEPITDIELIKHDDFVLWVTDPVSHTPVTVTPVAPRGAGVNNRDRLRRTERRPSSPEVMRAHRLGEDVSITADGKIGDDPSRPTQQFGPAGVTRAQYIDVWFADPYPEGVQGPTAHRGAQFVCSKTRNTSPGSWCMQAAEAPSRPGRDETTRWRAGNSRWISN